MDKHLVAIVLPMYNEEESIPFLRVMFDENLTLPSDCEFRIVAVNDGSSDRTLELITRWAREKKKVLAVSHTRNMGLGQAILTGFGEAIRMGSDVVVTMDADASHTEAVISQLVSAVLAGADIAIASRFAAGGKQVGVPLYRRFFSWGARMALRLLFPLEGVTDYTISFRAYRTKMVEYALSCKEEFLDFKTFAIMVELLLKMAPFAQKIVEIPICLRYDLKMSSSKLKLGPTLRDYLRLARLPKAKCQLGKGLGV
ncbi:MAG: glycosyltransferase [Syntrophomonadaceae bacterium]|nr:glycosyltransferase [Syntrophomonadaceae bacterium]